MELGQKLKQARLEAGLSQRQLCAEEITRNMLSQIENGAAHPSMATLRYLAGQLGKPVSYFLEEDAVTSPNQTVMEQARKAFLTGDFPGIVGVLEQYREPDLVFDPERQLLHRQAVLAMAKNAEKQGKTLYALQLLEQLGSIAEGYCAEELERQRLLLLGRCRPKDSVRICKALPDLDGELMLRARAALESGDLLRSAALLEAAQKKDNPEWNLLRGDVFAAGEDYEAAIRHYLLAEFAYPADCAASLERCYRELGNFERAYYFACKRREGGYEKTE